MNWIECHRCKHRWDDDNPEHEVCPCLDIYGWRKVVALPTMNVPFIENAASTTLVVPPGRKPE